MTSRQVPALGVGLAFQLQLKPYILNRADTFDYVEVVPEIMWNDLGPGSGLRYRESAADIDFLRTLRRTTPIVVHSIGLSIGSAHRFNAEHVERMAEWQRWLEFPWHSDHLAYQLALADHGGSDAFVAAELNAGLTLPLTLDAEMLERIAARVEHISRAVPVPFALENNVYYVRPLEEGFSEAEFMNRLCAQSGCRVLLDLHNLYTNARNLHFDAYTYLQTIDLRNVIEIHVAGGMEYGGFYLDAHSGPIPEPVWELLEWTLPRCPNVGGVTFELFGTWFDVMGEERLAADMCRLKTLWSAATAQAQSHPALIRA